MAWYNFIASLHAPPSSAVNPDRQDDIAERYTNDPQGTLPNAPATNAERWQAAAVVGGSAALLAVCFDWRPNEALIIGAVLGGLAGYAAPLRSLRYGPYLAGFALGFAVSEQLHLSKLLCWVFAGLGAWGFGRLYFDKSNDLTIDSLWK